MRQPPPATSPTSFQERTSMPNPPSESDTTEEHSSHESSGFLRPVALAASGLLLGVAFETLFYGRPLGVSFAIWVWLCIAALFALGLSEGRPPSPVALALAGLISRAVDPARLSGRAADCLPGRGARPGRPGLLVRVYQQGDLLSYGFFDFGLGLVIPAGGGLVQAVAGAFGDADATVSANGRPNRRWPAWAAVCCSHSPSWWPSWSCSVPPTWSSATM